jgi:hypothetical protein
MSWGRMSIRRLSGAWRIDAKAGLQEARNARISVRVSCVQMHCVVHAFLNASDIGFPSPRARA